MQPRWQEILLPSGNQDDLWELFHENSKIGRYTRSLPDEEVLERMKEFHESLPFEGYPIVELPCSRPPLKLSLHDAITTRMSARTMTPGSLTLEEVGALLHYAYGVTRSNKGTGFPRPFRAVPSAGALYPLEIFFYSSHIDELQAGLYHYDPTKNHLRLLRVGDATRDIANVVVQPDIVLGSSLIVFITAIFERSIFKYGDRGYRFIFIEAGHVAQNINLVSNGLGLGCVNLGGYIDRGIDDLLGLDGLTHSTIYLIAIGARTEEHHRHLHLLGSSLPERE